MSEIKTMPSRDFLKAASEDVRRIIKSTKSTKNNQAKENRVLEIKTMPLKEFLKTASQADEELLNKMHKRICDNRKYRSTYLDCADMPFYTSSDGRVFGGGECNDILSHRKGYGFTIISVGDRGSWICSVHSERNYDDEKYIAFYDGEFDEVYEQLIEYYGGEREQG